MDDKKKMGRPTNDPKDVKLTVRVNKATNEILEKYCKENNISNKITIFFVSTVSIRAIIFLK